MAVDPTLPTRRNIFRVGVADFVFVFFALTFLQLAGSGIVDDPGLGWHVRIVDAMAEQGGFLWADPFGLTTRGEPWVPFGFLGSAALHFSYHWGGLDALAVVVALTIAFTLRCLYRMMVTDGVPAVQAVVWTYLAALAVLPAGMARPNVFTLLFFLVTARVCVQWHRGRVPARQTLWLLPLFAVWANVHGGWAAGLMTVAAAGLVELGVAAWDRDGRAAALGRFRWFVLLGVGCGLATLVNPYGPRLHLQVLRLMGDPFMMNLNNDWLSWDFHSAGSFRLELLILLLPVLLAWSRHRPDAVSLVLCVLWLHLGLNGRRYASLWVLTAVPILAQLAARLPAVERFGEWLNENRPDMVPPAPAARSPWLWTAVAAVALFASTRYAGGYTRHYPDLMPTQALDKLLEIHRGEKVLHSINWGGYLIWHGWDKYPRFLVWIDDRNELYGRERIEEWINVSAARPGWRETLDRYGFELVCVPADCGLAYRLAEEPGWEKLYADDAAVIYRRKPAGPAKAAPVSGGLTSLSP
jgi:hypothetical protein